MASLDHDDGIEILATSNTMTSEVCTTSHVIDLGLTLVTSNTMTSEVCTTSHVIDLGLTLVTSNTMTSEVCTTSHVIDLGLTLVSATTDFFLILNDLEATVMTFSLLRSRSRYLDETCDFDFDPTLKQL